MHKNLATSARARSCAQLVFMVIILLIFFTGCGGKTPKYTLTVSVVPADAGTVFREPPGPSYKKGTTVTLIALENEEAGNYAFSHWAGDLTGDDNPATIIMNTNKNVTAHFVELAYNLTVHIEGEGMVTRKIVTTEGDDGPVQICLTANPEPGWVFLEWTGDLTGRINPAVLTLDEDKTITAHFDDSIGEVTGRITDGRAGPAVAGVTVTVVQDDVESASTETDSDGRYSLLVDAGVKVDLVAAKAGMAGSRFQGVVVSAGESFRADMVMKKPEVTGWDTTPPSLTVTGVSWNETIYGIVGISVDLGVAQEPGKIYIDFGAESPGYVFPSGSSSAALDTRRYPDGPSFINITAYDQNNNFVTTRIPVTIANDSSTGVPLVMRKPVQALAITLGDDMQMDSLARPGSSLDLYLRQNKFPQAQRDFSIAAAEERSACYVKLWWEEEFAPGSGFGGYNVYRSSFANGPWRRLGTAYDTEEGGYNFFDRTSDVTPGAPSYYQVVPYSSGGKEGEGQRQSVTPLGRFELNLTTPEHGTTGVSLHPTLEWSHNGLEADFYYYELSLLSVAEDPLRKTQTKLSTADKNRTSVVYDNTWEGCFSLQNNWVYQWDVTCAEAFVLYDYKIAGEETIIYSAAYSLGRKGNIQGSYNGAFVFTTGDAE